MSARNKWKKEFRASRPARPSLSPKLGSPADWLSVTRQLHAPIWKPGRFPFLASQMRCGPTRPSAPWRTRRALVTSAMAQITALGVPHAAKRTASKGNQVGGAGGVPAAAAECTAATRAAQKALWLYVVCARPASSRLPDSRSHEVVRKVNADRKSFGLTPLAIHSRPAVQRTGGRRRVLSSLSLQKADSGSFT